MLLITTGSIGQVLGCDRDKVSYAVRKLGIVPVGTAGQVRILPETAIEQVRSFLSSMEKRKAGAAGGQ